MYVYNTVLESGIPCW